MLTHEMLCLAHMAEALDQPGEQKMLESKAGSCAPDGDMLG